MDDNRGLINHKKEKQASMKKKAGIYIHIPFCQIKCMYCDFYSITKREKDIPRFVDMLIQEIKQFSATYKESWIFDTIFLGGGTPSLMQPLWVEKILNALHTHFNIKHVKEITLEANPGETQLDSLINFHKLGINRLSIGFQSFQPQLLSFLNRLHNAEDNFKTFENARNAGFENINIDMMFNIPGQTMKMWQHDLQQIIKLNPEHVSVYSLTVEPNTILYNQVINGKISMPSVNIDLKMFKLTQEYLSDHGYKQYEISSYAKPGLTCQHNLHYWNLEPYLAFGPSAHGYDGKIRSWNISSLDSYIKKIENNQSPKGGSEILSSIDHYNEIIFNGLRTQNGIQLKKFDSGASHMQYLNSALKKWHGKFDVTKELIRLKKENYILADEIASDLMQDNP